jgi:hypothetical protein
MEGKSQFHIIVAFSMGKIPQYFERRQAGPLGLSWEGGKGNNIYVLNQILVVMSLHIHFESSHLTLLFSPNTFRNQFNCVYHDNAALTEMVI